MVADKGVAVGARRLQRNKQEIVGVRHCTVVNHVCTDEPAPSPYYYGPYYGPGYAPAYTPATPITALPGAAVCLAFSLIGAC